MKWTYSIKSKTTAALLLAFVLGIILLINLVERHRFRQLEKSFSSIYEDRLMAESYLFHLYDNLHKKQDLLQSVADGQMGENEKAELHKYTADKNLLIEKYDQTYLTPEEEVQYNALKSILGRLESLEAELTGRRADADSPAPLILVHDELTAEAFTTLSALSVIQTSVGAELRDKSKQLILGSVSTSHFEMSILIVIAVIIQALVLSSRSVLVKHDQNANLN